MKHRPYNMPESESEFGRILRVRLKNKSYFTPEMEQEVERRIAVMENEEYEYPPHLRKIDWIGFIGLIALCLAVVVGLMLYCSAL